MKAYKRFEPGLICRGFKYPEGEWVEFSEAKLCGAGAHSCLNPLDTNKYYDPAHSEIREVEIEDVSDERGNDSKVVSKRIKVGAKLDVRGIIKAHVEYMREHAIEKKDGGDDSSVAGGYCSSVAGGYCSSVAGGHCSSVAGGYCSSVAGGDDSSVAGGYCSSVAGGHRSSVAGGDRSSVAGGYCSSVAGGHCSSVVSRGKSSVGVNGIACARGNGCKVKGGMGAVLVLVEESDKSYDLIAWKAVVVDGENIKPDTWYKLVNGELVEADDAEY